MMGKKHKKIIWEENTYSKFNIFRIGCILFLLFCSFLLIRWGIFELDTRLGLGALFILVITLFMLFYFLFSKVFFKIQFSNSKLIITQGNLGRTRKFELTKLMKVEIIMIKIPIWHKVGKKKVWTSKLLLILKVFDTYYKENVFIFKKIKSQLKTTKQVKNKEDALNLKLKFEDKLKELKNSFSNLIHIIVETKDQPEHKNRWIDIIKLCIFVPILIVMLNFMYEINPDRLISTGFGLLIMLSAVVVVYIFHKLRKSRIQNSTFLKSYEPLILDNNYMNFKRFIITDPLYEYERTRIKELKISSPDICPICGSTEISDILKIQNIYFSPSKFIRVSVCKEHEKLIDKTTWNFIVSIPFAIIFKNFMFIIISFFITIGILLISLPIIIILAKRRSTFIRKNIFFESFNDFSVISVKNLEWAEIFKKNNVCSEVQKDILRKLSLLDVLLLNLRKKLTIFIVLSIIFLFGLIPALILSSFFTDTIRQIIIGIYQVIFIFFIVICAYIYLYLINIFYSYLCIYLSLFD